MVPVAIPGGTLKGICGAPCWTLGPKVGNGEDWGDCSLTKAYSLFWLNRLSIDIAKQRFVISLWEPKALRTHCKRGHVRARRGGTRG